MLIQHQAADGRHRLGHRGDVEDGVRRHGDVGGLVAPAIGVERDQLAVAGDGDDRAGDSPCRDVGLQRFANARQPLAGKADVFGFGAGQGVVGECGAGRQQAKRGRKNSDRHHRRLPVWALRPLIAATYGNARQQASGAGHSFLRG